MCNQSNTKRLEQLSREMEEGATKIDDLEVPALLLLEDVCRALGLTEEERCQVLGQEAAQWVDVWASVSVTKTGLPR
jgi:hypothetical protein